MVPLVGELPPGHGDDGLAMASSDLGPAEAVRAMVRFREHGEQIGVDRRDGIRVGAEALELRMVTVAARFAAQNGAREQSLAPDGDQALRVEVARMQRPEARRASPLPAAR